MVRSFRAEPELRRETGPHAGGAEDDLQERGGMIRHLNRPGEAVEEVHPAFAGALRKNAAEPFVHAPPDAGEEVEAEEEEPERGEDRGRGDRADADDVEPFRDSGMVRELVPAQDGEVDEEAEDGREVEHALGDRKSVV